jgi:hypothetical protein
VLVQTIPIKIGKEIEDDQFDENERECCHYFDKALDYMEKVSNYAKTFKYQIYLMTSKYPFQFIKIQLREEEIKEILPRMDLNDFFLKEKIVNKNLLFLIFPRFLKGKIVT